MSFDDPRSLRNGGGSSIDEISVTDSVQGATSKPAMQQLAPQQGPVMDILKGPDLKKINLLDAIVLGAALKSTLKRQLYEHLRRLISGRILAPGSAMPSTRQLAKDLAIGRNTVVAA